MSERAEWLQPGRAITAASAELKSIDFPDGSTFPQAKFDVFGGGELFAAVPPEELGGLVGRRFQIVLEILDD